MCSIWLELGDNRIPMTRKELESLAGCIRSHRDLGGIDADILDYLDELDDLDEPVRPNPRDDTLEQIRAIGADTIGAPLPDDRDKGWAQGMLEIGSELVELGTDWVDNSESGYHSLLSLHEHIRHWVEELRNAGHADFASDVCSLMDRLDIVMQGEPAF